MRGVARVLALAVMVILPAMGWAQPDVAGRLTVPPPAWQAIVAISTADEAGAEEFLGTGFVLTSGGIVATAWPNIAGSARLTVAFPDGERAVADEVIGWDQKRRDVAVLKAATAGSAAPALGGSETMSPGASVVVAALGRGGQRHEYAGTIGAAVRLPAGERWLKLEGKLPETASGGPAFDTAGKVVGLALVLPIGRQTVGFLIPIEDVVGLLEADRTATKLSKANYPDIGRAAQRDFYVAELLADRDMTSEAMGFLEAALKTAPEFADARASLGWCKLVTHRPEEALNDIEAALDQRSRLTHPDSVLAMKAEALLDLGRDREARSAAEEAVHIAPGRAVGHFALGSVYAAGRHWSDAETQFLEAVQLEPKYTAYRCRLARVYMDSGRGNEAVARYKEVTALDPADARARCGLGYAYYADRDVESGIAALVEAARLDPALAGAHAGLGHGYAGREDWEAAREEFERALELDPKAPGILRSLAWVARKESGHGRLGFMVLYSRVSLTKWAPAYGRLSTFSHGQLAWFLLIALTVAVVWQAVSASRVNERRSWRAILWAAAMYPALLAWSLHHLWLPGSTSYLVALVIGAAVALAWVVYGASSVAPLFSVQPDFSKAAHRPRAREIRPEPPPIDWTAAPRPGSEPVKLCRVGSAMEAEVVRSALSAAGIPSVAHGYGVISAYLAKTTRPQADDYVLIFVPRNAVERARSVLAGAPSRAIEWPAGLESEDAEDDSSRN